MLIFVYSPSGPWWGFRSESQRNINPNGELFIYVDTDGTEHVVTQVDHNKDRAEQCRQMWPDAGPLVGPLLRYVRTEQGGPGLRFLPQNHNE